MIYNYTKLHYMLSRTTDRCSKESYTNFDFFSSHNWQIILHELIKCLWLLIVHLYLYTLREK